MRCNIYLFCLLALAGCGRKPPYLEEIKQIPYPSASGIEFFNNQLYVIGDDASYLLILDSALNRIDSLQLYPTSEVRIAKNVKADLEAISVIRDTDSNRLLLVGSGSLDPFRSASWVIDPFSKQKKTYRLDTFYQRLKNRGLTELNIEGACSFAGQLLLSNRGHKGFPRNHLILTSKDFLVHQSNSPLSLIKIGSNEDSNSFQGVSGLAYARRNDKLLLTVSTEDTRSTYEDGAIGKSYLWIVDNISAKRRWKAINPTRIIDLEEVDPRFKGQKIESVSVIKESRRYIHLALAADNDKGSSVLFTLVIERS